MKCTQCGAEAPAEAAFCPKCGAQLGVATPPIASRPAGATHLQSGAGQGAARDVPEEELWEGGYSPKAMIGWYLLIGLIAIGAVIGSAFVHPNAWIAVVVATALVFAYLTAYAAYKRASMHYRLTTHRFVIQKGLLSRTDNRILLVDVDDITVRQGFVERLFNLGTIVLRTTDETTKEESPDRDDSSKGLIVMDGIEHPRQVADAIDESRRAERTRRGVYMMNA